MNSTLIQDIQQVIPYLGIRIERNYFFDVESNLSCKHLEKRTRNRIGLSAQCAIAIEGYFNHGIDHRLQTVAPKTATTLCHRWPQHRWWSVLVYLYKAFEFYFTSSWFQSLLFFYFVIILKPTLLHRLHQTWFPWSSILSTISDFYHHCFSIYTYKLGSQELVFCLGKLLTFYNIKFYIKRFY